MRVVKMLLALLAIAAAPAYATPVPAQPAAAFYQSLGVNAHAWYVTNAWPQRLVELGVPNVRGKAGTSKDYITKLQPFFATGGKLDATVVASSGGTLSLSDAEKNVQFLKTVGLSHVSGIEGPNEFNINHTTGWAATERAFVQKLHDYIRADSAFNGVPIIAPSVWKRLLADYQALGNLSTWVDRGTIHYYSGQRRPTLTGGGTLASSLTNASILAPGKPIWMTESGWQAPTGSIPISTRAQAKYVVRDYFDAFATGKVEKLFMYQLMDDGMAGGDFGLTDDNANPKPAFYALKNLAALVKDGTAATGSLDYSIPGAPASLKQLLLEKSDGSFLLAVWLDVDSYDVKSRRDLEYAVPVTVNLGISARSIEVYQPTFSATVVTTSSGSSVSMFATDSVTVVRIAP